MIPYQFNHFRCGLLFRLLFASAFAARHQYAVKVSAGYERLIMLRTGFPDNTVTQAMVSSLKQLLQRGFRIKGRDPAFCIRQYMRLNHRAGFLFSAIQIHRGNQSLKCI